MFLHVAFFCSSESAFQSPIWISSRCLVTAERSAGDMVAHLVSRLASETDDDCWVVVAYNRRLAVLSITFVPRIIFIIQQGRRRMDIMIVVHGNLYPDITHRGTT